MNDIMTGPVTNGFGITQAPSPACKPATPPAWASQATVRNLKVVQRWEVCFSKYCPLIAEARFPVIPERQTIYSARKGHTFGTSQQRSSVQKVLAWNSDMCNYLTEIIAHLCSRKKKQQINMNPVWISLVHKIFSSNKYFRCPCLALDVWAVLWMQSLHWNAFFFFFAWKEVWSVRQDGKGWRALSDCSSCVCLAL